MVAAGPPARRKLPGLPSGGEQRGAAALEIPVPGDCLCGHAVRLSALRVPLAQTVIEIRIPHVCEDVRVFAQAFPVALDAVVPVEHTRPADNVPVCP